MITAEEAKRQLELVRKPKVWMESRKAEVEKLEGPLCAAGRMLLGFHEDGKAAKEHQGYKLRQRAIRKMQAMSSEQLFALGQAFLPKLQEAFAGGWEIIAQLPVTEGYVRRAFHSADPRRIHARRAEWVAGLVELMQGFDEDVKWLAAWIPHVRNYDYGVSDIGLLLAGAINKGGAVGAEVKQILKDSASGTHEIGMMGRHVTTGLLCCQDEDAWEFVEKLLLAAQRQEGLRQAILETVDCAHPGAFARMTKLILDQRMCRFSSVIRAADVWFGFSVDAVAQKYVEQSIETMLEMLGNPGVRAAALEGDDADRIYMALWCTGYHEIMDVVAPARKLLTHRDVRVRAVAVQMLTQVGEMQAYMALLPALDDEDPRIVAAALQPVAQQLARYRIVGRLEAEWAKPTGEKSPYSQIIDDEDDPTEVATSTPVQADVFTRLEKLYERTPVKMKEPKALELPWPTLKYPRAMVLGTMLNALGERQPTVMLKYLDEMEVEDRHHLVRLLRRDKTWSDEVRATMLKLAGDSSPQVREAVVKALERYKIGMEDAQKLLPLLSRKAEDLRRGILHLVAGLKDEQTLSCAKTLLQGDQQQRLAGLDLLRTMVHKKRAVKEARAEAQTYQGARKELGRDEQVYLEEICATGERKAVTLEDALGLMDPAKRTAPAKPVAKEIRMATVATTKLLESLDELVHQHRQEQIEIQQSGQKTKLLLGEMHWQFPEVQDYTGGQVRIRGVEELPLAEVWLKWWDERPSELRDTDGLELVRLRWLLSVPQTYGSESAARKAMREQLRLPPEPKLRYARVVYSVVEWITHLRGTTVPVDTILNAYETVLALGDLEELTKTERLEMWRQFCDMAAGQLKGSGRRRNTDEETVFGLLDHSQFARFFALSRYYDEPGPKISRNRIGLAVLGRAFREGMANEHDIYDTLLGTRSGSRWGSGFFTELSAAARRKAPAYLAADPRLVEIVDKARRRVLEVELTRGEQETAASNAALDLEYSGGADVLIRLLQAMGKDATFKRNIRSWTRNTSKACVYSHLVRVSWPGEADTPDVVAKSLKAAGLDQDTLIAVAFFAPQWAPHVEKALEWESFEEAVWWIHAHTKDSKWSVTNEIREAWNAQIRQRTPLTLEDLTEGATDVAWFRRVYEKLGKKRWLELDEYAKYASSGAGHARARLFADAMLGLVSKRELVTDITKKRKQDAVRAIGLLPLAKEEKRQKDLLERYKMLQEFVRTSRQFGSMRQASEKRAAAIGQENLARCAGYPDPIRLQWAMEAASCADLAKGPVVVKAGEVAVSLAIGEDGLPEVSVTKAGKELKSVPPAVKKLEAVQELQERKTDLRRSASRMRLSLELAMCRGDRFAGCELQELVGNPMLRPMLQRLVFVGESVIGYPDQDGKVLHGPDGSMQKVAESAELRIAHPHDLLKAGNWSAWQRECFAAERVQPFKQVFRELYVLTDTERQEGRQSRRYGGQQVNPRQAMAILGQRGWVAKPEEGVFRPFFDEKIVAWIGFMETFHTPAEVEGLTIETIHFARRGEYESMKLEEVPPRVLSEVMRDIDLIVSVAHRGQVDPEASASTVEMRAALLRETCLLLKRDNVQIKPPHVVITGEIGEYSLHLGSGNVHKMPGGMLFIVPVHSQHRGRIFLPFADDDPKTAEIMSKALLLSRDREIQDPALLQQIRSLG